MQDNYASPATPSTNMTFSNYGIVDFDVEYWNVDTSAWVTVAGGNITGNNKVWRQLTFAAVTTTKIKVVVNNALNARSRITEVEAWGTVADSGGSAGSTTADIKWLVTDQLGTPRMVFDNTGSLADMKRHDYLPFGEELFGGPPNQLGAGGRLNHARLHRADSVHQKFTQKERDNETGLDYFGARYFASTQGRFTSPDPFSIIQMRQSAPNDDKTHTAFMLFIGDPRRWNRFAYAVNSPLVFTDKTGLDIMVIENCPTSGNPIGHTAIAITGRGVYSMGNAGTERQQDRNNNILGGGVRDYLEREIPRRDTTLTIIKTTAAQDAAAEAALINIAKTRPMLESDVKIAADNCSTRVNEALDAAGVASGGNPAIPGTAGMRLKVDGGLQGTPTVIEIPQNSTGFLSSDLKAIQQFEPTPKPSNIPPPGFYGMPHKKKYYPTKRESEMKVIV